VAEEIVRDTLYRFSQGMKVAVECTLMVADAGLLDMTQEVIAVAGTDSGADTAIVCKPAYPRTFHQFEIREVLAKPRVLRNGLSGMCPRIGGGQHTTGKTGGNIRVTRVDGSVGHRSSTAFRHWFPLTMYDHRMPSSHCVVCYTKTVNLKPSVRLEKLCSKAPWGAQVAG
jgi:hypothetical protein